MDTLYPLDHGMSKMKGGFNKPDKMLNKLLSISIIRFNSLGQTLTASDSQYKQTWLMLGSLAIAMAFVFLLCFFFDPRWMTNDDVAMSMIAHGYGLAAVGSPNLIFPNVLWGYFVRSIPEINGVLGYSIATFSVLIIVGAVVFYGLYQSGLNYIACLSILALVLVRPVIFPQFTINSGLLLVGAIVCWYLYEQQNNRYTLALGCLLAFASYLVRIHEFILVFVVALPFIPWRTLWSRRDTKVAFFVLVSAIAAAAVIDYQAYQGDEWKAFNELQRVRAPFTDLGYGEYLKQRADILQKHGYSINDIDLIPNITDPQALREMAKELGFFTNTENALAKAWIGIQAFWHPQLLPLVLSSLLLVVLQPSRQIIISWGIAIAAVFTFGLFGRPGILRVYIPLLCLFLIAPFFKVQLSALCNERWTNALLMAAILNANLVFYDLKTLQTTDDQQRLNFINFPSHSVIVWGAVFPFEAMYPAMKISAQAKAYNLYVLGWPTIAPFARHSVDKKVGHGLTDLIVKETGISIVAIASYFKYLEIYCQEHLHGQLKELDYQPTSNLSQRRCELTNEYKQRRPVTKKNLSPANEEY